MWKKEKEKGQRDPPLEGIRKLADRSGALRFVLEEMHILQVIEDHQLMWCECTTDTSRASVCKRLHRQIARAIGRRVVFGIGWHGAGIAISGSFVEGSLLFLAAAVTAYILGKGT